MEISISERQSQDAQRLAIHAAWHLEPIAHGR